MSRDWGRPGIEPTLEEALTDPIVLLVMRRGRVTADEVRVVVEEARRRYRQRNQVSPARVGNDASLDSETGLRSELRPDPRPRP